MKELDELEKYLAENGYIYSRGSILDGQGEQIAVWELEEDGGQYRAWDVICVPNVSYGARSGLLEAYGDIVGLKFKESGVEGWLTAKHIITRLEERRRHYFGGE